MFFPRKKRKVKEFDRDRLRPVIRCSICTGERTAGFQDLKTGKFTEVMLIRSQADLEAFRAEYGLEDIPTVY